MILCFERKKTLNVIALEPSSTFKKTSAQSLLILDDSNYFWMSDNDILKKKKEFIEFKKCVKNFKRHLVEAIVLMTVSIVFIYALFFFYR